MGGRMGQRQPTTSDLPGDWRSSAASIPCIAIRKRANSFRGRVMWLNLVSELARRSQPLLTQRGRDEAIRAGSSRWTVLAAASRIRGAGDAG